MSAELALEIARPLRELKITRRIAAPRTLVYRAWTRPRLFEQWWGPQCDTAGRVGSCEEMDLWPGGRLRWCLRDTAGVKRILDGIYWEIAEPERLIYAERRYHDSQMLIDAVTTASFEENGGVTIVTIESRAAKGGSFTDRHLWRTEWNGMLAVLARRLTLGGGLASAAEDCASEREIIVTRMLEAPDERVFRAWTEAAHISRWWGPRGFAPTTHEMNVRPGGTWRFTLHGADGTDYNNKIVYLEIGCPQRLVYLHGDDPEGADPPFHVTVTFAEQDGHTLLTMRLQFESAKARNFVVREFDAVESAHQSLDRLAQHLETMA